MIYDHTSLLKKIMYFSLIQNERLSQWGLAKGLFPFLIEGLYENITAFHLYLVSQQLRENFISPWQRFNPPPTFFVYGDGALGSLVSLHSQLLSSSPTPCFQICTETVHVSGPLLQFLLCCMKKKNMWRHHDCPLLFAEIDDKYTCV